MERVLSPTLNVWLLSVLIVALACSVVFSSGCQKGAVPPSGDLIPNATATPQKNSPQTLPDKILHSATVVESPYSSPTRPEIEVRFDLTPGERRKLVGFRDLRIEQATTESELLRLTVTEAMQEMVHRTFIVHKHRESRREKKNDSFVPLLFQYPARRSQNIETLKGELMAILASDLNTYTVENIKRLIDQRQDLPGISKFVSGTSIIPSAFDDDLPSYAVLFTEDVLPSQILLLTSDGSSAKEHFATIDVLPDGRSRIVIDQHSNELNDHITLQLEVASKLSEEKVRFDVRALPLPELTTPLPSHRIRYRRSQSFAENEQRSIFLQACTKRSELSLGNGFANAESQHPIEIQVEVFGDRIADTVAVGHLKIQQLRTNAVSLLRIDDPTSYFGQMHHGYATYTPDDYYVHPPVEGVIATYQFEPPPSSVTEISEFAGELKLVIAESHTYLMIGNLMDSIGTALQHPLLQENDLLLVPKRFGSGINISLTGDDALKVTKIVAVDENGGLSKTVYSGRQQFGEKTTYSFHSSEGLPSPLPVRIRVNDGLETLDIPFRFTNLAIPSP